MVDHSDDIVYIGIRGLIAARAEFGRREEMLGPDNLPGSIVSKQTIVTSFTTSLDLRVTPTTPLYPDATLKERKASYTEILNTRKRKAGITQ